MSEPEGRTRPNEPLLYHKTKADILRYQATPVAEKLSWLAAQMEFFHQVMPEKAKRIRDRL